MSVQLKQENRSGYDLYLHVLAMKNPVTENLFADEEKASSKTQSAAQGVLIKKEEQPVENKPSASWTKREKEKVLQRVSSMMTQNVSEIAWHEIANRRGLIDKTAEQVKLLWEQELSQQYQSNH